MAAGFSRSWLRRLLGGAAAAVASVLAPAVGLVADSRNLSIFALDGVALVVVVVLAVRVLLLLMVVMVVIMMTMLMRMAMR